MGSVILIILAEGRYIAEDLLHHVVHTIAKLVLLIGLQSTIFSCH